MLSLDGSAPIDLVVEIACLVNRSLRVLFVNCVAQLRQALTTRFCFFLDDEGV